MNAPATTAQTDHRRARIGLWCGLGAYTAWGVLPVYFKALASVSPLLIVAHRIIWSLVALAVLVTALKRWPAVQAAARNRKALTTLGEAGINIATFNLGRRAAGGEAVALVSVDGEVAPAVVERLCKLEGVREVVPLSF